MITWSPYRGWTLYQYILDDTVSILATKPNVMRMLSLEHIGVADHDNAIRQWIDQIEDHNTKTIDHDWYRCRI